LEISASESGGKKEKVSNILIEAKAKAKKRGTSVSHHARGRFLKVVSLTRSSRFVAREPILVVRGSKPSARSPRARDPVGSSRVAIGHVDDDIHD
jgi:hypothetical protein